MKHFIFDFGAVVFQWRPPALLARLLPHRTPDEAATQALAAQFFQGYGGDWSQFDRGSIDVPALVSSIAARTGLTPDEVRTVIEAVPDELAPLPDTVSWLGRLQQAGHRLYYLSNMPEPYAAYLQRTHAFLQCFRDGIYSSHVGLIKPEPAIFELALQRFGVLAQDCIFLDDHPDNVQVARRLGIHAIQFHDAAQALGELRDAGLVPA